MTNGSARQKQSFVFLLLLTAAALYLSWLIARPYLTAIITATLLAVTIYPLFIFLLRHVRNRSATALLTTAVVLIAILLPTVFIVNTVANETSVLSGWLNEKSSGDGGLREYFTRLTERPLGWMESKTGISRDQLRSAVTDRLQDVSASLLNWAKSLAGDITRTILDTFIMLFTLFYLLRDGRSILNRLGSILPLESDQYRKLLKTISDSIIANIYGVLAVALAQAVLGALGYWIAGLPNVMLWTFATAIVSMIPVVGAVGVWGVGVIYLAVTAHWGKALFLLVYGAGVISMADNIVRPLVLSGRVKLNTLLVFFSILGGMQAFGFVGLFVGPITVSVAAALLGMLAEERKSGSDSLARSGGPEAQPQP